LTRTTGKYLLDTNIVIAALSSDAGVLQRVEDADEYFVSATILGEMFYDARHSANSTKNLDRLKDFVSDVGFLSCDVSTARYYGQIKALLRQKGKPIPENDIWIAASAIQYSLTLATRDLHFDRVDGLQLSRW